MQYCTMRCTFGSKQVYIILLINDTISMRLLMPAYSLPSALWRTGISDSDHAASFFCVQSPEAVAANWTENGSLTNF